MKRLILLATVAAMSAPCAIAQTQSNTANQTQAQGQSQTAQQQMPKDVQGFVKMAVVSNMFEIQSSQLAMKQSDNEDIQQFATRMVADHTKAGNQLKEALQNVDGDVQVPTELDQKHQQMMQKLQGASGNSFDQTYRQMQVQAHEQAVQLFQYYSENGEDGPVKEFASKTLPTLKEHRQMLSEMPNA
ncbi:DUF4142 domain-containing protein [Afifella sp. JA880]|uniref:DUF4142 domain-containing protein n=1 Tax=Afifella sp. JA880 TaxID=2975280 RepID=UPI0021BA8A63|nr:DUF4142 domain-containing protein [Afifella sp. JA880]MCT8266947.1 DUF4142 domain-containing protein [Afifella sp. JA880]